MRCVILIEYFKNFVHTESKASASILFGGGGKGLTNNWWPFSERYRKTQIGGGGV